jgi:hypothetical protein
MKAWHTTEGGIMRSRLPRLVLLAGLAVLGLAPARSALAGPALRASITDGFNGSTIDANRWTTQIDDPSNFSIFETGGVLSMRVEGGAADNARVVLWTRCAVHGDFDARVSFSLPLWPWGDRGGANLDAGDLLSGLGRFSDTAFDQYGSYLDPLFATMATNDLQGRLRLTRHGSVITSYVLQGQIWRQLNTNRRASTADTRMDLQAYSGIGFGHQPFNAVFDSFSVHAQRINC